MSTITIQITVRPATRLLEFFDKLRDSRRIGMVYYQRLENGDFISRCITAETDTETLKTMIREGKVYISDQISIAQTS